MKSCSQLAIVTCLALAGSVAFLTGCTRSIPEPASPDGHQQVLALLKQIKSERSEDPLFGDADLKLLQQRLSAMPENAPPLARVVQHLMVSAAHMRMGNNLDSVRHMEVAIPIILKLRGQVPDEVIEDALFDVGVACLRLGEVSNCVHCQTGESCILPIQEGGIHQDQTGSLRAIHYFTASLKLNPDNDTARWLLNIAHMTVGSYPDGVPLEFLIPPSAFDSDQPFPRFPNIAKKMGLNTMSLSGGAIAEDFDNDGWLDIVVSQWDPAGQMRYFRNNADGTFEDLTEASGLEGLYGGLNMLQADYDNDGDVDILVLRGGWEGLSGTPINSLIRNEGGGKFRDVTMEAGLGQPYLPTQTASWADYDLDGDLDLYIGNEDSRCQLFENQGDGTFIDQAKQAGVQNNGFTKGVVWGDYDGDRYPDLYVSNYGKPIRLEENSTTSVEDLFATRSGMPNRLYHNNGDGTFTDVAEELDVTRPLFGFPVWFWDFNNDGALDLFAASFEGEVKHVAAHYLGKPRTTEPHFLYQGDGKGGFRNVAPEMNLTDPSLPMGANFGDLDNDGFLDFYLGTGSPRYDGLMPNLMYRNQAGKRFADITTAGGFGHLQKGHGVAFADLDNDGDQDVFEEMGGAFPGDAFGDALYANPGFGTNWITIKLVGTESNRSAIGTRIKITVTNDGEARQIYRWVGSGGSFGANPLRQEIGLGNAEIIDEIQIYWPKTDKSQTFRNVDVDQSIEITEGDKSIRPLRFQSADLSP